MNEQQWAAIAMFKSVKSRAAAKGLDGKQPRHRRGCPGRGFTVMVTPKGPVTVPCLCCDGGGE